MEKKRKVHDCTCRKCNKPNKPSPFGWAVFTVCEVCGNKRCPKADDHNMKCTNSNELNQISEPETTAMDGQ